MDKALAIVSGTTHTYRSLVDGTVRFQVDVEPRDVAKALEIMPSPGVAIQIVRLNAEASKATTNPDTVETQAEKKKTWADLGPMCQQAVSLCLNMKYWEYLSSAIGGYTNLITSQKDARAFILQKCSVGSRKELDTNPEATTIFKEEIVAPYEEWLKRGET